MDNNSTILPKVRIEEILLSFKTIETYNDGVYRLKQYFVDETLIERKILDAFSYLVEHQLGGSIPTLSTLEQSLSSFNLNFKGVKTYSEDELDQIIDIFIKHDKNRRAAVGVSGLSELILNHGVSHPKVAEICNDLLSNTEVDGTYDPIHNNFKEIYENQLKDDFKGISFLCSDLDRRTGGIMSGTVCTLLGGPGSMKTTTAVNIAYNAMKDGKNVAFLSLEETPLVLYGKLLSRVSVDVGKQLSVKDITQNSLDEKDKDVLLNEVEPYLNKEVLGRIYIIGEQDLGNYSANTIESKLKEADLLAKRESAERGNGEDHGIDLLVVDHIQLLKYAISGKDEFAVINYYVSFFRQQSLSFLHQKREIAVMLLSQANREGLHYAQRHDGQYLMQHVAEASEIERSSTYIISVYTDATVQISKLLKMGAVKLRGAALPMDTINVYAEGEYYQVGETELPDQQDYDYSDVGLGDVTSSDSSVDDVLSNLDDLLGDFK